MSAPVGNRFWEQRTKHGRDLIFETPEKLWECCVGYFAWVDDNPLPVPQLVKFKDFATQMTEYRARPMTLAGLCIHLDITFQTWREYAGRDDFSDITARVEAIIRQQKFEGAVAGTFNPSIIARDLGLAEKHEHTGKDGAPIQTITKTTSAKEASEAYMDSLNDKGS